MASLTVMGRCLFVIALLTVALEMNSGQAHAGFLGHNYPGDFGLLSGTQPGPRTYLSAVYLRYDSDTLRNRNGDCVSLGPTNPGEISLNGYAAQIYQVTNFKILGGNYGFLIYPGFQDAVLEAPILGLVSETGTGLTDIYVQPINLGWHTDRADFITGLGVFAPTGRYDPDASDNLGLGMWSFEVFAGTTIYFDTAKTWHFATTAFYETHTEKEGTDITVGDILTLEGGFGKSFMGGALNVGIAYFAQWKVTDDDLPGGLKLPKHRGFGVGPEVTIPIATKSKLISLITARYIWETGVRSSLEGNTFLIYATFPIPSVPMGGDLKPKKGKKAPTFMVYALRDTIGGNLDRIQIIKGWLDKKGTTHERIYDVAVSDGRKIDKNGHCKTPVGSTVNIKDASYTNTIGDPLLTAYWKDADFDPKQKAFYYVRVIEIPKPRWTAYDAKFFKVKMPKEVPMTGQDRAYARPIWYTLKMKSEKLKIEDQLLMKKF